MAESFSWEQTLKQCNGKQDLAEDLTNMLRNDLPQAQRAIATALKQNDLETIYSEIHKLHGSCAYCSMPKLKSLIAALETDIKTNQVTDFKHAVKAIDKEIEQVKKALQRVPS